MDNESEKATSQFSFKDRLNMFEKTGPINKPPINRSTKVSYVMENKDISPPIARQVPTTGAVNNKTSIISHLQDSMKPTELDKKYLSYKSPASRPLPVPPPLVSSPPKRDESYVQETSPQPVQLPPKANEENASMNQFPKKILVGKLNKIKDQKPPPILQPPPMTQLPPVPQSSSMAQLPPVPQPPSKIQPLLVSQPPPIVQPPPKRNESKVHETSPQSVQLPPKANEENASMNQFPKIRLVGKLNEIKDQKPPPILQPPPMAQLPPVPQPSSITQLPPVPPPAQVAQPKSSPVGQPPPIIQLPPKLSDLKVQNKTLFIKPTLDFHELDDAEMSEESREQISQLNLPIKRILSPHGDKIIHPPLPQPPPLFSKVLENPNDLTFRSPDLALPPLPPPPQTTSKSSKKGTVLVGWVKPQNTESVTNDKNSLPQDPFENKIKSLEPTIHNIKTLPIAPNIGESKTSKIDEPDKPPPIVVPPPSLEVVRKIRERDSSPSLSNENNNSVRSSVQSAEINNEDQYDEDEDFSSEPWYFDVSREEATKLMKNCLKKGTYLIRPSQNNQYVLMVRIETNEVKKFKIQKYSNGWILGDPSKAKKIHDNLSSLVTYYVGNGVKFGTTTLTLKESFQRK